MSLLVGRGGVGKSTLGLQIAAAIASGVHTWLPSQDGTECSLLTCLKDPAHVVYWSAEDELEEVARRLARFRRESPYTLEGDLGDRLHALDAAGQVLWMPRESGSGHVATLGELTQNGRWLRRSCEELDARLVVVDSLAAAYGSDENQRGLVRAFLGSWDAWARDTRCAVLIIAHPPKSGSSFSGSTDWEAGVRAHSTFGLEAAELNKSKKGESKVQSPLRAPCLVLPKTNYGQDRRRFWIVRSRSGLWYSSTAERAAAAYEEELTRHEPRAASVRDRRYGDAVA